jgi:hypothetical protein
MRRQKEFPGLRRRLLIGAGTGAGAAALLGLVGASTPVQAVGALVLFVLIASAKRPAP